MLIFGENYVMVNIFEASGENFQETSNKKITFFSFGLVYSTAKNMQLLFLRNCLEKWGPKPKLES